jgi:hypothetical protein
VIPARILSAALVAGLVWGTTGCATMHANRMSQYRSSESAGSAGRPSVLRLTGFRLGDEIHANGERVPVEILMSEAEVVRAASLCEFVFGPESSPAARARLLLENCPNFVKLGVFLDRSRQHTIRVVRGGAEHTRTVRATWRFKWFWIDGLFGPGAFVAWAMDARSGAWREFGNLNLDEALATRR